MIYLDYNATAPLSESVQEYVKNQMVNDWANPSSEHDAGYILNQKIKKDRAVIAEFLGVSTKGLFFTSGATESINTVLSVDTLKKNGIDTIISSRLEHHATLHRLKYLEKQGFKIEYVGNSNQGIIDFSELENKLASNKGKALASFLYVNNETGTITDVKKVVELCHENDCLVHLDAVQALGKLQFDLDDIDPDFASFSGHKIGALKGIGLLYCSDVKKVSPYIYGGGQESGIRPGTSNYPAIHSFRLAIDDVDWDKNVELEKLRDEFEKEYLALNSDFRINASDSPRVGNTSNIYLGGREAREVLLKLSREKIYVSTGSACSSGSIEPSHVIQELGFEKEVAKSSLRLSFGSHLICKSLIEQLSNTLA